MHARPSATVLAAGTVAVWNRLRGRRRDPGLWRTRDDLYSEARAIGIHGRGGMTKAELASAIRHATAPTRAHLLAQAGRRRATAMRVHVKAALDSPTRLARTVRLDLAPALTASRRFQGRTLSIPVALLAAVIGGAMPLLVYGMDAKGAQRVIGKGRAHPLATAFSRANVATSAREDGREQSISKRRAHAGNASPTAGSQAQRAPLRSSFPSSVAASSSAGLSGSHAAAAPESSPERERPTDQVGANSDEWLPSGPPNRETAHGKPKNAVKHHRHEKHSRHEKNCDERGAEPWCVAGRVLQFTITGVMSSRDG